MDHGRAFPVTAFDRAHVEGVNLYARPPAPSLELRRASTPQVDIAWNARLTRIEYKASKSSLTRPSSRQSDTFTAEGRPPWSFQFKASQTNSAPASQGSSWTGGGAFHGSSGASIGKAVPDAFGELHRRMREKKEIYTPWYLRTNQRSGQKLASKERTKGLYSSASSDLLWRY
ncbi:unnamed protein product [Amoebophrya sp. A25]|nr:unnamed protein product [Amoebophrya sp. A25]|eukprot:GSA25T00026734001.1